MSADSRHIGHNVCTDEYILNDSDYSSELFRIISSHHDMSDLSHSNDIVHSISPAFVHLQLKQGEDQSEAVKRKELHDQIEHLRAEISHLDTQISGAEDQLTSEG